MKYVPNILSIARIFMSLPLLLMAPFTAPFMGLYITAGITDMIDGPIARRTGHVSKLGANLDGAADLLLAVILIVRTVPAIYIPIGVVRWIAFIVFLKLTGIAVGYFRHKQLVILHTIGGKFVAFAGFMFPIMYLIMETGPLLVVLCAIATFAYLDEVLISWFSEEPETDVKSFISMRRAR